MSYPAAYASPFRLPAMVGGGCVAMAPVLEPVSGRCTVSLSMLMMKMFEYLSHLFIVCY